MPTRRFHQLGELVETRWRRTSYREGELPQIAYDALGELALHDGFDWRELLHWAVRTPLLDSDNQRFGDVALRVFESARFYVEVLLWNDGALAIHDHAFAGAFSVLAGSSLHLRHGFHAGEVCNTGFVIGDLALERAERLAAGDVRAIEAGRSFVHAVYHLARPTVSLVVRSRVDLRAVPQLTYVEPGIAFDASVLARDAYAKPLAALRLASQLDGELYRSLALEAVSSRDIQLAFEVVMRAARTTGTIDHEALVAAAAAAHPALASHLPRAVAAQARLLELLELRRRATLPELRELFALLLNVPRRDALLELVALDDLTRWLRLARDEGLLPSTALEHLR